MNDDATMVDSNLPCPDSSCGSSDAYVIYDSGWGHCFSCGKNSRVNPDELPMEAATAPPAKAKGLISHTPVKIPSRNITRKVAASHGFGEGKFNRGPCQVADYCDPDTGKVIAQKIKLPGKKFTILGEGSKLPLWQQHRYPPGAKKLLITEGETDLLCWQSIQPGDKEWPAVSLPNGADPKAKSIRNNLDYVTSFDEVILCFDNDEAGKACAEAAVALLPPGKAKIMKVPGGKKDICEASQAGLDDELRQAFWNAQIYRPDGIVGSEEILAAVLDFDMKGTPTPWPGLNEKTYGLRMGELVTITAGTGIGKSHICRILAWDLIKKGHRVGYISLEESLGMTGLALLGRVLDKPLHMDRKDISDEDLSKAWADNLDGKVCVFNHFGSMDAENLLNRVRFMRQAEGCDFIVVDHLSILVSGWDSNSGDERRLIDNVMTALRSIVAQTGVGMLLVSHLSRGDTKAKTHEEGGRPRLRDLRGSQAIPQLSDTVIALSRDQQGDDPNLSEMWVLKCRYTGLTGRACHLTYAPTTGRMVETEVSEADDYGL